MARLIGPDEGCRVMRAQDGPARRGCSTVIYADASCATPADILTLAGAAIPGSRVTTDAYSLLPLFQFPSGVDTVYTRVADGDGDVMPLYARTDDRLDASVQKASNLSDLPDKALSRQNLGAQRRLTNTGTKTATYTAADGDFVLADATSGAFTVTLPAASVGGQTVAVKKVDTSANPITIQRAGSDAINAAATSVTLSLQDEVLTFTSNGAGQWWISGGQKSLASLDGRYAEVSAAAPANPAEGRPWLPKPAAIPIVIDTDWWTDAGDPLALRVATSYEKQGLIDIRAVCASRFAGYVAGSIDAFLTADGRPDVPVGYCHTTHVNAESPTWQQTLFNGYTHKVGLDGTGQDAVAVYRTALAQALTYGEKVDIVAIGPLNNLQDLLQSSADSVSSLTGMQLVTQAVGNTWIMGGQYPTGTEYNFNHTTLSRTSAAYVVANWPLPITFNGYEASLSTWMGGNVSVQNGTTEILWAAMSNGGGAYGRPAWDAITVMLAALGGPAAAGFTTVQGTNVVDASTGANTFTPGAGTHYYVVPALSDYQYANVLNPLLVGSYAAPVGGVGAQVYRHGRWQALKAAERTLGVSSVRPALETGALTSSLIMHLHADDLSSLGAAAVVAHWQCRMNSLSVQQIGSVGARPTFNTKGGKNALICSGTNNLFSQYTMWPRDMTAYVLLWLDALPASTVSLISSDTFALTNAASTKNGGLKVNASGNPLTVAQNGGTATVDTSTAVIPTGAWHNVAFRYSYAAGKIETMLDGTSDAGTAYIDWTPRYLPINIGTRYFDHSGEALTGGIREVRIYSTRHDDTTVASVVAAMT